MDQAVALETEKDKVSTRRTSQMISHATTRNCQTAQRTEKRIIRLPKIPLTGHNTCAGRIDQQEKRKRGVGVDFEAASRGRRSRPTLGEAATKTAKGISA